MLRFKYTKTLGSKRNYKNNSLCRGGNYSLTTGGLQFFLVVGVGLVRPAMKKHRQTTIVQTLRIELCFFGIIVLTNDRHNTNRSSRNGRSNYHQGIHSHPSRHP
jgi:hypothetical protein